MYSDARRAYQREYQRRRRALHKDELNAKLRADRAADPQKYRDAEKKYRAVSPEKMKARRAKYRATLKGVLEAYKHGARIRGFEFSLDPRLVDDLTSDACYYCGAAPSPRNGIDRVRNERGYAEDNVVTACKRCNRIKRADSMESFVGHAKLIAARFA